MAAPSTPPTTGHSACKGCGKPILWAIDDAGKKQPLDTTPPTWVVIGNEKDGTPKVRRSAGYVSHFATCPAANQFSGRNKDKGKDTGE